MTKVELIAKVAETTGMTKKDTASVVNEVFTEITNAVVAGDKVAVAGFGTFQIVERAAREGVNPKTKEKISIPAKKTAKFKASKTFKDAVNA